MMTLTQYQVQVDTNDALYLKADEIVRRLFTAIKRIQSTDFDVWNNAWQNAGLSHPDELMEELWDEYATPLYSLHEMKSAAYDLEDQLIEDIMEELANDPN